MTIPTTHHTTPHTPFQTLRQAPLSRPPLAGPLVPADAFQPPATGAPQAGGMTIYVGNGGTVNNTFTSAPAVGPVAVPPQGPPATHRTWLTPGVIAAAMLFVIAGACGLLSLSYAPLERMAQVMTGVATTTGALTAIGPAITTALRRHTNYQ